MIETLSTLPTHYAGFIFSLFCFYPTYKTFQRAGLNTRFSIFILIPFIGLLIVISILAHSTWTTVPPLKKREK